jgi:HlyD family secretion protein
MPARASFVSDVAQFTPKTVETEEERQKLMFRVKASIDPDLLRQHLPQVKTGLPGMAYLKLARMAYYVDKATYRKAVTGWIKALGGKTAA